MVTTTNKKTAAYKQIFANANAMAKNPFVKIGVLGAKATAAKAGVESQGLSVVDVATFHEFGTIAVPQRSFLRAGVEAYRQELTNDTFKLIKQLNTAALDVPRALKILGAKIKSLIQRRMRAGIDPKLEAATIKRKGSSKPLIDTGQLINSIDYAIELNGD